ncbi:MAG TPA: PHP domain-containing protein [Methanofastidiosum sp.]|nr:PHP domain-containing protein [Methanofastidiosum sp.]HPA49651.1 PHP domain-containing protein [Methanofastidiosum sp.]HQK63260.1 PHP domain-containing protein [Methanofastidiosum sp.]HQM95289.1 PHP domain-containing protein [Methanofastidiosum sp.]HQQ48285.1 PHP domain-containing protein [Methanofastidiosum sp.]
MDYYGSFDGMSKIDTHIHTKYSGNSKMISVIPDCISRPERILKFADKKGIDLLAITDHDTIRGGIETEKLAPSRIIVGEEISTSEGELLGLFLNESIPPNLSPEESIERVREQGGLAIAAHPYSVICPCFKDLIYKLKVDGIEVFNAFHRDGILNRKAAEENKKIKNASLAGSDAHTERMVGNAYTLFKGNTAEDFYKAVKKKKTIPQGQVTSMGQTILWNWNTGYYIMKRSMKNIFQGQQIKKNSGLLIGSSISVIPVFPILTSFVLNRYHTKKVKKNYPWESFIFSYMGYKKKIL